MHAFKIPQAAPTRAKGISNAIPPAIRKQPIKEGSANTNRITATTFAKPQVTLNARPIALMKSHANAIKINNSNMFILLIIRILL